MFAVVEIMGRRTRAGAISDAQLGGSTLLRIEHPTVERAPGEPLAEYYAPSALFAIRPCSIEEAAAVAGWAWVAAVPTTPSLPAEFAELVDDDDLEFAEEPF
jgi:hypothetical protein